MYTHRRLELELREGERERKRERWEEEVFRDDKPIWSLVYKAIFFLWSQSKLVVNGITLHKEYEWANLSKEAKYKHKNITDSRHAYSALLRSNHRELVQIQMVVSLGLMCELRFWEFGLFTSSCSWYFCSKFLLLEFLFENWLLFLKREEGFHAIIHHQHSILLLFSGFMWIKTVRFNLVLLTFNSKFDNSN